MKVRQYSPASMSVTERELRPNEIVFVTGVVMKEQSGAYVPVDGGAEYFFAAADLKPLPKFQPATPRVHVPVEAGMPMPEREVARLVEDEQARQTLVAMAQEVREAGLTEEGVN